MSEGQPHLRIVRKPITPEPYEAKLHHTERINGVKLALGRMSMDELLQVEGHCKDRLEGARMDLWAVQDHMLERSIEGELPPEVMPQEGEQS